MAEAIVTPLTQALAEGKLTREELKSLMQRSDAPAFRRLAVWVMILAVTTTLITLAWDSWLIWPAMFLHGVVLVHHFSIQHECVHYTVFRTRWLNDLVGQICGLIIILPHRFFRYEHCDHHTYTQLTGDDPEMIPMPKTLGEYLWYISAIPYWKGKFNEVFRHAMGRLSEGELRFIPKVEHEAVFWDARRMLGGLCGDRCRDGGDGLVGADLVLVDPIGLGRAGDAFCADDRTCGSPHSGPDEREHTDQHRVKTLGIPVLEHELSRRTPLCGLGAVSRFAQAS